MSANNDANKAMLAGADKLMTLAQPSYAELIAETERGIAELKRHLSERGHWPTMQPARPAGWSFVANQDGSVIVQGPNGGCVVRQDATESRTIPEAVLWELAKALASAPAPALVPLTEAQLRDALTGTNHMIRNAMSGPFWPELIEACRAIERAHGIGGKA